MMQIALILMACAVFAALAALAIAAVLRAARIDDLIGEVFSPWIEDPSGPSPAVRDEAWAPAPPGVPRPVRASR